MPGDCPITDQMSRALGSVCSMSWLTLKVLVVLVTSTTGEAPVTVTDSCSVASCSCTLTVAVNPIWTMMPSRRTFENPAELVVQRVDADGKRREPVLPLLVADRRLHAHERRARRRHRHTGQHGAGVVGDRSVDTAGRLRRLRESTRTARTQRPEFLRGHASYASLLEPEPLAKAAKRGRNWPTAANDRHVQ